MTQPTVPVSLTIAVCTYNRAALLTRMLASIQRQTRQDFDVLILDDCSTDGTRALCEGISGPRFRYVRNATNLGFNANYNQALALPKTSHVLLTHDDDFMDPSFIDYLRRGIEKHPEALMVTTNVRLVAEDETPPAAPAHPGFLPVLNAPAVHTSRVVNANALNLAQDVVFARGEYGRANYWKGLGLYCPTYCFHRERSLAAKIEFEPVGPGSDVLISLRTNLAGPIAVLGEAHFNVCTHAGQDHASAYNELTAGYRLDRVAIPIVRREAVFAEVRPVAEFNLAYHFGKAATAALVDLVSRSDPAAPPTPAERYARHVATLPAELREVVFKSSRNRVAARLFGHAELLDGVPRVAAAEHIRHATPAPLHNQKWNLLNFSVHDRLDELLAAGALTPAAVPRQLRDRRIVLWGFCYLATIVAELLHRLEVPVAALVDRNAKLHGSRYRELVCRPWKEVWAELAATPGDVLVLTATEGAQEVDIGFDLLSSTAGGPRCAVHNWRAVVDWLEAAAPEVRRG